MLGKKLVEYIRKNKKFPYACKFSKFFKNGAAQINYNPTQHDKFPLKIVPKEHGISDIEEFFKDLKAEGKNPKMNKFTELAFNLDKNLATTHNKNHIAIKTSKRNFIWFHPRMGNYNYVGIRFNLDSANSIKEKLVELNLLRKEDSTNRYSIFYLPLEEKHLQDFRDDLDEIISQAISDSS